MARLTENSNSSHLVVLDPCVEIPTLRWRYLARVPFLCFGLLYLVQEPCPLEESKFRDGTIQNEVSSAFYIVRIPCALQTFPRYEPGLSTLRARSGFAAVI